MQGCVQVYAITRFSSSFQIRKALKKSQQPDRKQQEFIAINKNTVLSPRLHVFVFSKTSGIPTQICWFLFPIISNQNGQANLWRSWQLNKGLSCSNQMNRDKQLLLTFVKYLKRCYVPFNYLLKGRRMGERYGCWRERFIFSSHLQK